MAGASIEINDAEIIGALRELLHRTQNLKPVFDDFGDYMQSTTVEERFEKSRDPLGHSWAEVKYHKPHHQDKPLIPSGHLMGELNYDNNEREFQFGSNKIYAATHQFGRPEDNIPARPFLGINDQDKQELLTMVADFLRGAL